MKNRSTIRQGLYVGLGLLLANAVILPLLSEKTFARGVREGVIGGVIVFVLYAIWAAVRPAKGSGSTKESDPGS
jgi:hypothetical protein